MAIAWLSAEDTDDPLGAYTPYAVKTASYLLYKLTAEKYTGSLTTTENYALNLDGMLSVVPKIINGQMINVSSSSVSNTYKLRLRHSPVTSISEVSIGGNIIPFSEYELRNNAYLVRKDKTPWMIDRNRELSVTYTYGTPPPIAGKVAAIRLANEIIWAETDIDKCSLPARVTSASRQGLSITVLDPQAYIEDGKTGIYEVDMFINAANPIKAKKKPKVYSPDKPFGERINHG